MISRLLIAALLSGFMFVGSVQASGLSMSGSVRLGACTIHPDDEEMDIPLDEMTDRYFYNYPPRTRGIDFHLRLLNCRISVVDGVKIKFSGVQNAKLPGLLALDPSSTASGIAIGIETASGTPLPLETASSEFPLVAGDNTLAFRVYAHGEPEAIANQTIGLGTFSATVTFELEYM